MSIRSRFFGTLCAGAAVVFCAAILSSCGPAVVQLPRAYWLTYDANGATSGSAPAASSYTPDTKVTLPGNTGSLAKNGFVFNGWNTVADGSGTKYASGSSYTMPENAVKLYADWQTATDASLFSTLPVTGGVAITGYTGNAAAVIIPSSIGGKTVVAIGASAFSGKTAVTSVQIPDTVTAIGNSSFTGCTALTSVTIPNAVTTIDSYAFDGCSKLASVTIPASVTKIGSAAFRSCAALKSIVIPSVQLLFDSVFENCIGLTSVTIPESVTNIDASAFEGCTSLPSVTIPSKVTVIGDSAFSGCTSLDEVVVTATEPPAISATNLPFESNAATRLIKVPSASLDKYKAAEGWKSYLTRIVSQ